MLRLLVMLTCSVAATPFAAAQETTAASASVPSNLKRFTNVRPAIPMGMLQSWIVRDGAGERVAVTTPDGFAIVGEVIGPGGQDLSSALLAISGLATMPSPQSTASPVAARPVAPSLTAPTPVPATALTMQIAPPSSSTTPPAPTASLPTSAGAVPPIALATARTADELFQQATDFSVWFSAGTPKPNAPAIYFVADPTCPHCAVAVDVLAQKVKAGDIDLRVILAPIRNQQAVYEAVSILQSKTPAEDFMSHELSKTTSTVSTLKVLAPKDMNAEIVRGLQRNVEWMRANGVQGVPFWIYMTADGGKVEFGEVRDAMLSSARPARGSAQVAQGTQP